MNSKTAMTSKPLLTINTQYKTIQLPERRYKQNQPFPNFLSFAPEADAQTAA